MIKKAFFLVLSGLNINNVFEAFCKTLVFPFYFILFFLICMKCIARVRAKITQKAALRLKKEKNINAQLNQRFVIIVFFIDC